VACSGCILPDGGGDKLARRGHVGEVTHLVAPQQPDRTGVVLSVAGRPRRRESHCGITITFRRGTALDPRWVAARSQGGKWAVEQDAQSTVTKKRQEGASHAHSVFGSIADVARGSPSALGVPYRGRGRPGHNLDRARGAETYVIALHPVRQPRSNRFQALPTSALCTMLRRPASRSVTQRRSSRQVPGEPQQPAPVLNCLAAIPAARAGISVPV
jgi:hypothetical protein